MSPLIEALLVGNAALAQELLDRACRTHSLWLIPDHEPMLFSGVFIPRQSQLVGPAQLPTLARSWEQWDRAMVSFDELGRTECQQERDALDALARLLQELGLRGLVKDHLFVVQWPTSFSAISVDPDESSEKFEHPKAERLFRAHLKRGRRLS